MKHSLLSPFVMLRLEGVAMFVLAAAAYAALRQPAVLFALLLFAPDLSMVGYLRGTAPGAALYNLAHNLLAPALVLGLGAALGNTALLATSLIWTAHLGMDRALGYGLKYPTEFRDTHLNRV